MGRISRRGIRLACSAASVVVGGDSQGLVGLSNTGLSRSGQFPLLFFFVFFLAPLCLSSSISPRWLPVPEARTITIAFFLFSTAFECLHSNRSAAYEKRALGEENIHVTRQL